jgi:hypothetical protein
MSAKFIQHRIYPTKLSDYKNKHNIKVNIDSNENNYYVIQLPKEKMYDDCPVVLILPENEHHSKTIVECCFNLLANHGIPNIKGDNSLKKHGVHPKLALMLHMLSRVVGYLINCTSWEEQDLKNYDKHEINKRLDFCKL